ncbi:hypothetical protein Hanom_Chr09g00867821 [Helianthus anomalus]
MRKQDSTRNQMFHFLLYTSAENLKSSTRRDETRRENSGLAYLLFLANRELSIIC